jgi:hypothetical protein
VQCFIDPAGRHMHLHLSEQEMQRRIGQSVFRHSVFCKVFWHSLYSDTLDRIFTVFWHSWHSWQYPFVIWHSWQCARKVVLLCIYVGFARTVYMHRIWPYVWWFPAKNTICTLYIPINVWFWPTLLICIVRANLLFGFCLKHHNKA